MATFLGRTSADILTLLAEKLDLAGGTMTGDLIINDGSVSGGSTTDTIGTALKVVRNGAQVGRIDNNSGGMRVQAQAGTLQLRGSGNSGVSIDSAGVADFASEPKIAGSPISSVIGAPPRGHLYRSHMPSPNWVRVPFTNSDGNLGSSAPIGVIYFCPYFGSAEDETQSIDRVGLNVETAGSADSMLYMAVYDSDPATWMPTSTPIWSSSAATDLSGQKLFTLTSLSTPKGRPFYVAMLLTGTTIALVSKVGLATGTYTLGWYGNDQNAALTPVYQANAGIPFAWKLGGGQTALGDVTGQAFTGTAALPMTTVRYM